MAPDFNPTARVVEPENRPDQLAEAVLASLSRGRWGYRGRPWGVIKTAVLSVFTLGLAPLLCWPRRMHNFMSSEHQQLWQLAEWMRLRTGKPEATALRDEAARAVAPSELTSGLQTIVTLLAVVVIFTLFTDHSTHFVRVWSTAWNPPFRVWRMIPPVWNIWTVLLTGGYLLFLLNLWQHAAAMENFVARFNQLTKEENIEPVHVPGIGIGIELAWIALGIIGVCYGAIWAIPLAFAGAVQSRYVWVTSRQTRAELANRVRTMLASARPALNVRTTPRASSRICSNDKCHAPLRPGATFCPRCGTRTT